MAAVTVLPATDTYRATGIEGTGGAGPSGQLADVRGGLDLFRPWALLLTTRGTWKNSRGTCWRKKDEEMME